MSGTQAQTDQNQPNAVQASDLAPFTLPDNFKMPTSPEGLPAFTLPEGFDPSGASQGPQKGLAGRVWTDVTNGLGEAVPQVVRGAEKALNETSRSSAARSRGRPPMTAGRN